MTKIRTNHTTDDPPHVPFNNPEPASHPDPYKDTIEQLQQTIKIHRREIDELRETIGELLKFKESAMFIMDEHTHSIKSLNSLAHDLNTHNSNVRGILQSQNESNERLMNMINIQKDSIELLKNIAKDHGHIHRDLIDTVKEHGQDISDLQESSKQPSFFKRMFSKLF